MPADYHTHTPLCKHAEGEPEEFIAAAIAAGVSEYGISDHAPAHVDGFDDWRMDFAELDDYMQWIDRAKSAAEGKIPVRIGLECDWISGHESWIDTLAEFTSWDYLIGSVHYLSDWDFDNPAWLEKWAKTDVEDAWDRYWKTYAKMADSGMFDIMGHADLIKKFGYKPTGDLRRYYEPAVDAIASSGCAIELNTAGWHKPCAEAYPEPDFLDLAFSAGIPLVISSDSHHPSEVARDFDRAITWAREAGYTETVLFDQRQRSFEPLPEAS
ncbi:histidinol-phosphatase HisJ family protein [Verrucomicrobiaceae bacterium 5K15]|uniref:Histidinol-phosphatase n=1 Tax=Oceaniferula flava TaxID=2800421 RepID=A0AAE2SAN8_9BACT|nr:histidinol-phosphatase HisJ family protein [Oceaniferula flavus]MBK1854363.1 histidinol-phosphatase HisJ family protein [Oceaniferula flavus]MBM1135669.1 histidinol-phosphatase HisJ family protein [Oceaniferula flavus]